VKFLSIITRHRLVLSVAVLLVGVGTLIYGACDMICAGCGKPIIGDYIEVDGRVYHPEHFVCAYCGKPIGRDQFIKIDSLYYHSDCYLQNLAPRCVVCNKVIEGEYYEIDGKLYHALCYAEKIAPRCAVCGKPILDSLQRVDSLTYHYNCYWDSVVGTCAYCGGSIRDSFYTDYWGNRYHARHQHDAIACDYCGRLISDKLTGGGVQYSDGRNVCNLCASTSITDRTEAYRLMLEVADSLARDNIIVNTEDIIVNLLDRDNLQKKGGGIAEMNFGITHAEYHESDKNRELVQLQIEILYGLPRTLAYTTLAHELMHARLFQNLHSPASDTLTEGSCHYAAYLALHRLDSEDRDFYSGWIADDINAVYGGGFRRVRELVREKGFDFWLDWIDSCDQFPNSF